MPMQGLDNGVAHASDLQKSVTDVRYICGYWGCIGFPALIGVGTTTIIGMVVTAGTAGIIGTIGDARAASA